MLRGTWDALRVGLRLRSVRREVALARHPASQTGPILLIAGLFPPTVSGGVYRALALVESGAALGAEFIVVAGVPYEAVTEAGRALEARVPPQCRVSRIPFPRARPDPRLVPEVDGGIAWALSAYTKGAELLRDRPPQAVVAMGPPFASFVAGSWLAARFGARLVLDYGDEWSGSPFTFVRLGPHDRDWERNCLRRAATIVHTTRAQLERHARDFPSLDARRHVIDNPWQHAFARRPRSRNPAGGEVRIGFFGRLADHALPGAFLADLERLLNEQPEWATRLTVTFVGQKNQAASVELASFGRPAVLRSEDLVTHEEAVLKMAECDALLLLTNERLDRYRPGKLTEYIASGRPVLAHGSPRGESASLIRELGAGWVVAGGDTSGLSAALCAAATTVDGPTSEARAWLATRSGAAFARRMLSACGLEAAPPTP